MVTFLLTAAFLIGWAFFWEWVIKKYRTSEQIVADEIEQLQIEMTKAMLAEERRQARGAAPYRDLRHQLDR
jgi:hypothetical protein